MSERRSRRPDGRQPWEDDDRKNRNKGDRPRDRDRRDNRDDRDRRQYRSRSRDRRDRNRSRSPRTRDTKPRDDRADRRRERDELPKDRNNRDSERSSGGQNGRDGLPPPPLRKDKGRNKDRRRSASPPRSRSASPRRDGDERGAGKELPTRAKGAVEKEKPVPMSFKVGGGVDDARGRGRERSHDHHDREDEYMEQRESLEGTPMDEDEEEVVVEDDGMDNMQAMMGFGGFGTTKNKKVPGNNVSGVRKEKKTEYRQYMNRVGGFNRPLSPSR